MSVAADRTVTRATVGSINPPIDPKNLVPSKKPLSWYAVQEVIVKGSSDGGSPVSKYVAVHMTEAGKAEPLAFPYGIPNERRWAAQEASNAMYREAMGWGARTREAIHDVVPEIGQKNPIDRSKLSIFGS
jgi:hypothetical protein